MILKMRGFEHLIIIHSGSVLLRDRSKEDNECPIVMPRPLLCCRLLSFNWPFFIAMHREKTIVYG